MDIWQTFLAISAALAALELVAALIVFAIVWHFRNKLPRIVIGLIGLAFIIAGVYSLPTIIGAVILLAIGATFLDIALKTNVIFGRVQSVLKRFKL